MALTFLTASATRAAACGSDGRLAAESELPCGF
jgi:hypothetical protein